MAYERKTNANGDWYYEGNIQKGLVQNLDSEATTNSQPNKDMNAGSGSIKYADPQSPSTNPATRREKYGINQGTTVPESTKIGAYDTVSPVISTDRGTTPDSDSWNQYTGYIKKIKGNSFITAEHEKLRKEIEQSLKEQGYDTTKEIYGQVVTDAVNNALKAEIAQGAYQSQLNQISNTQAYNIELVNTLTRETWAAIAQGKSVKEIAEALGQEEWVIQKIANNEQAELIQLSQQYEDEQMRSYLRYKEDLDTQIARNITQYQNAKTNLDYQFNSAVQTLKRNLFDSEWTARGTAAGLGMTGTSYLLDRIQNQYNNQMMDLQNTYEYQSANAQIAINNALEDYTTNVKRYMEDYAQQIKGIQSYVLEAFQTASNNLSLSTDQRLSLLDNIKKNVEEMKANAIVSAAAALEDGNTALYNFIANTYGLDSTDFTTHQFTNAELGRTSSSTIGNDTNNLGHILASDDGTRIGTYKSANGYTYNVYATREDGLLATQGLLQRAYYGKTLKEAAQKWIGQGKDISGAVAVLKELKLDPNAILSDENVRKFMEAIGRREGTIKKGETLDDWVKGGKDLSSYTTTTTSAEGTTSTNFVQGYEQDYTNYLKNGTDGFKKASQEQIIQKFGSWDNFVANAQAYKNVIDKQVTDVADTMLRDMITLRDWLDSEGEDGEDHSMTALRIGFPGTDAHAKKRMYKQIIASDALQNLINLKSNGATFGALSNQELGFITEAANWFNLWDNEENFVGELNRKINKILDKYNMTESEFLNSGRGSEMPSANITPGGAGGTSSSLFNVGGTAYGTQNTTGTNSYGAYQSGTITTGATPIRQN